MRRIFVIVLLVAALVLTAGAVGCGEGSPVAADDMTPQQLLGSVLTASENLKSATGTIDLSVQLDADTGQMPDEAKAIFAKPITVAGTYAAGDTETADLDLAIGVAGESLNFALKSTPDMTWLRLNGRWYEMPPEMLEGMMGQTVTTIAKAEAEAKLAELMKLITDLGVDPTTWIKDMTVIEEKIDGVETYHIKGAPDVAKVLTDYAALMKSEEFVAMIGSFTEGAQGMDLGGMIPSPDELQQAQNEAAEMFKDTTIELWVGKQDFLPRQLTLVATIVPPAEEADGLNSMTVNATIVMKSLNQTVSVAAPESPLPFTDLMTALQKNPEELLGPLGGMLGGLSGF